MSTGAQNIVHSDYSRPYRRVLSASTLSKDSVRNRMNEDVGSIKEIMLDVPTGRVAYAVLSVGGFLGIGDRYFAIPWESLTLDEDRQCFVLDVDKRRLENAPGFDKANWPDMADTSWGQGVHKYWTGRDDYGVGAALKYDQESASVSDSKIFEKAQEARRAIDGPEGEELRRAERIGKEPIKK
jgi:sporulation protein YlmC with PRC-barrel domain